MSSHDHEKDNQVFLTQIGLDVIKTEDTKPLSFLPDCLGDTSLDVEMETTAELLVCTICLSTSNIVPLPHTARDWLAAATNIKFLYRVCGVCSMCNVWVHRSTKLVQLAKKAQVALVGLAENGELNIASIRKLKKDHHDLVQLSSTSVSLWEPECQKERKKTATRSTKKTLTKPTFVEVKVEIPVETYNSSDDEDNYDTGFENTEKIKTNKEERKREITKINKVRKAVVKKGNTKSKVNNITEDKLSENVEVKNNIENIDENSDSDLDKPLKTVKEESLLKFVEMKEDKSRRKVKRKTADDIVMDNVDVENIEEGNDVDDQNSFVKDILDALRIDAIKGNKNKVIEDIKRVIQKGAKKPPSETPERDQLIDKYFRAKNVPLDEQRDDYIQKRMSENYETSPYKCDFCYQGFMGEKELEAHLAGHPKNQQSGLTCNVCDKRCNTAPGFLKHVEAHLEAKRYYCRECNFQTNRKTSARVHAGWHHGKRYECEKCGLVLKRQSNLLSHMRVRHPSAHVCALCGFSFVGEKGLRCHKLIVHKAEDDTIPEDGPLCEECDIRFKTSEALTMHIRVSPRHGGSVSNQRPAKGSLLKPKPPDAGRRRRGNKDPKNLREYHEFLKCEQCNEQIYSRRAYRMHFNKFHPDCTRTQFPEGAKPSLCDLCGKVFMSVAALAEHTRCSHAGAAGGARYKCDVCNKVFQKAGSLATHRNVHLGRRFPCPICGKAFNQVCNRDRHYTYVHSTIRDVKCDFCEKMFKNSAEKKMHITYVHFKKPYKRNKRRGREGARGGKRGESPGGDDVY